MNKTTVYNYPTNKRKKWFLKYTQSIKKKKTRREKSRAGVSNRKIDK